MSEAAVGRCSRCRRPTWGADSLGQTCAMRRMVGRVLTSCDGKLQPIAMIPESLDDDLRQLVTNVNGFVYAGDRLNAVVDAVRALRDDPELAARLLGGTQKPDSEGQTEWRVHGDPGKGYRPVDMTFSTNDPESQARALFNALARPTGTHGPWPDGPHLSKRTVLIGPWEKVERRSMNHGPL